MNPAVVIFAIIMFATFTKGNEAVDITACEAISGAVTVATQPLVPLSFVEIISDPILSEKLKEFKNIDQGNLFKFLSYIRSCNMTSEQLIKMFNNSFYVMSAEASMPKFLRDDFRKFVNIVRGVDEKNLIEGLKLLRSKELTTRQIVNIIITYE